MPPLVNDAAALRDADVGISVDTAVDIAKESADIIAYMLKTSGLPAGSAELPPDAQSLRLIRMDTVKPR